MTLPEKETFTKEEIQVGFLRYKNWKFSAISNFLGISLEETKLITKSLIDKMVTVEDSISFRERLNKIEEGII